MPTYAPLEWDKEGQRPFETGVDHGVLWVFDSTANNGAGAWMDGVCWNGLTAVTEKPSGAEPQAQYADNIKYLTLLSAETFDLTIESFFFPDAFKLCDGTATLDSAGAGALTIGQQKREKFAFSYRTLLGDDLKGSEAGSIINIVYGCLAAPTERGHNTVNDSPEAGTFSWEVSTTPIPVTGFKPTSILKIEVGKLTTAQKTALEAAIYGSTTANSTYKTPSEILTIITSAN